MNFKNLMFFIALGLITFSSCKKDNTAPANNVIEENKTKLIGTWNVTESMDTGCTDSADNETMTFGCETEDGVEVCTTATLTFTADGTYSYSGSVTQDGTVAGTEEGTGTWEIIDATQMTLCLEGTCTNETYTLTANSFTTTGTDSEFGCTTTVTATK